MPKTLVKMTEEKGHEGALIAMRADAINMLRKVEKLLGTPSEESALRPPRRQRRALEFARQG